MPPRKRTASRKLFIVLGSLMMIVGFALMLIPVMQGQRLPASDPRLLTGFITVVTGAMLLTKSGIAVFFYFLYSLSFLIFQIRHHGVLSWGALGMLVILLMGIMLVKNLQRCGVRR